MPLVSCEGERGLSRAARLWSQSKNCAVTAGREPEEQSDAGLFGDVLQLLDAQEPPFFFSFYYCSFFKKHFRRQLGCTFVTFLGNLTCRENCRPVSKVFSFQCIYLLIDKTQLFICKMATNEFSSITAKSKSYLLFSSVTAVELQFVHQSRLWVPSLK